MTERYRCIIADPPWKYSDRMEDMKSTGDGAASKYNVMDERDIQDFLTTATELDIHDSAATRDPYREVFLTLQELIADDCYLWLWTTNAFMEAGHRVCRAWGFEPKTIATWVKGRLHISNDYPLDQTAKGCVPYHGPRIVHHFGQGHHLRNSTEHCILAVRGHMSPLVRNLPTAFVHPGRWPGRLHSEKPPVIHEWAEQLGPGPRLEIFGRRVRENWHVIGDQL